MIILIPSAVYVNDKDLAASWDGDIDSLLQGLKESYLDWRGGRILLPEKTSQIIDETSQSRVNCMPCTVPKIGVSGVKLVSVYPNNPSQGLPNVMGQIVLLDFTNGSPIAVLDAGFITSLRTALVGGLASTYLAPNEPKSIALIGSGEQAFMHLLVMSYLYPSIETCRVASRSSKGEERFKERVDQQITDMTICTLHGDYERATTGADIIVTAISGQKPILQASWIKEGAFYCHVGGIEDDYSVPKKADKIVCDSWNDLKHRGSPTIAHMFREGLLSDGDIYAELPELISGEKPGRERDGEFIYFNSIGTAFTDLVVAQRLFDQAVSNGRGHKLRSSNADILANDNFVRRCNERRG